MLSPKRRWARPTSSGVCGTGCSPMSDFATRKDHLECVIAEWESFATPIADKHAPQQTYLADLKQTRLAALKKELAGIKRRERRSRKPRGGKHRRPADAGKEGTFIAPDFQERFFVYPKAMRRLRERLNATKEELAAWVFLGPALDGIDAYLNVDEVEPPDRFNYYPPRTGWDYCTPLLSCWFIREEVVNFKPSERYITGSALIKRWRKYEDIDPAKFIGAQINEGRLQDIHPITGHTRAGMQGNDAYPPLKSGLFPVSEIEAIEETDFNEDVADQPAKDPGHLNHDLELQARANGIAKDLMEKRNRNVTRNAVAKHLAEERGLTEATVVRRIRKQW